MILEDVGETVPSTLILGILSAAGYRLDRNYGISVDLFTNAINKLIHDKQPFYSTDILQLINRYINQLYRFLGEGSPVSLSKISYDAIDLLTGRIWIVGNRNDFITFCVHVIPGSDLVKFETHCSSVEVELAVMLQWLAADMALRSKLLTMEGHTISLGMWLAAKLYEVERDEAGKCATIDMGKELRGLQ